MMRFNLSLVLLLAATPAVADEPAKTPRPSLIVVVGAAGSEEFGRAFSQWAERWSAAAKTAQTPCTMIGIDEPSGVEDRQRLQESIEVHQGAGPLWLVLIGHGTFDGKLAKFNLRGPDVASKDIAQWLGKLDGPVAVINCTSSSGPFLPDLSATNRVVITATRAGSEVNFARLGDFLSSAITDRSADLDKDEQVSLLEAYLVASAKLREFYAADGRLATEHALIDDNGDKLGTPADFFQGVRPVKAAKTGAALDGNLARQFVLIPSQSDERLSDELRKRRTELEQELIALRERKAKMSEAEYLSLIEPLLVELAKIGQRTAAIDPGEGQK